MRRPLLFFVRRLLVVASFACLSTQAHADHAKAKLASHARAPHAWCADEPGIEPLGEGMCHVDGGDENGRRTLVIFLHGAIAKDVTWQWTQERALLRQARQSHFHAIFPRSPEGPGGYAWPGSAAAQEAARGETVARWSAARRRLEARFGKPFDEVFVMGFSSGAYYVSSLALRGALDVDGYAAFAGGGAWGGGPSEPARRVPVFVGVCADDAQTAPHSRAFGGALAARGFPVRVEEQHVGHMFGDAHVAHAVAWLRSVARPR